MPYKYEPIAVSDKDAADALGIGRTMFRDLVKAGHLPGPRQVPDKRRKVYDFEELRTALRCWQRDGEDLNTDDDPGEEW